jgi:uncharacterized membrane protein
LESRETDGCRERRRRWERGTAGGKTEISGNIFFCFQRRKKKIKIKNKKTRGLFLALDLFKQIPTVNWLLSNSLELERIRILRWGPTVINNS